MSIEAHRRYIDRLRQRRDDPFYMQQAKWLIKKQAPSIRHIGQQYEEYLEREDAPETAKAQAAISQQQKYAEIISGAVEPARLREEQHRKQVTGQIEEAEYQLDVMEEQKKEQEEARKRDFWKNLLKTGGGLVGTIVSPFLGTAVSGLVTGGMEEGEEKEKQQRYWENLVEGVSPGVGELAGSVIGESIYGSKYYSSAGITQGMTDIALEIATASDLSLEEERGNLMAEIAQSAYFKNMSEEEKRMFMMQMQIDMGILSPKAFIAKYKGLVGL